MKRVDRAVCLLAVCLLAVCLLAVCLLAVYLLAVGSAAAAVFVNSRLTLLYFVRLLLILLIWHLARNVGHIVTI